MDRLRSLNAAPIALAVAITLLWLSVLSALRWMIVIAALGSRLSFGRAMQIVLIGSFFNQTLLSLIGGDAVRVWYGYRAGLDLPIAFKTVILDRLVGIATLLLVIAVSLPWTLEIVTDSTARRALWIVVVAGMLVFSLLLALSWLPASFHRWPAVSATVRMAAEARGFVQQVRYSVPVVMLSVITHCLAGLVVFIIACAIDVQIRIIHVLILTQPVMLIAMLPISIAGWGLREGAMVVAFGFVGVQSSASFLVSVMFGVVGLLASLPGGLIWLLSGRTAPESLHRLRAGAARK